MFFLLLKTVFNFEIFKKILADTEIRINQQVVYVCIILSKNENNKTAVAKVTPWLVRLKWCETINNNYKCFCALIILD